MNPQGHRCMVKRLTSDEVREVVKDAKRSVLLTDDQIVSGAAVGRVTAIGDDVTLCAINDCVLFVDREPFSLSIESLLPETFMVEEESILAKVN